MNNPGSEQIFVREQTMADRWDVTFKFISGHDIQLRVAVSGEGPLVILVHGFPESWYSWRHQIKPLVDAGYQVAIPDVRGYGGSDKPHDIAAYSIEALTADMAAIANELAPDELSVIVGHDWGAPVAWNSALLYPNYFRAVAGLSVPYLPPAQATALDLFQKIYTDKGLFYYMVYFQEEGIAEAELQRDPQRTVRLFYSALSADAKDDAWLSPKPITSQLFDGIPEPELPLPWLAQEDVQYYASQFDESGFRGPLNRYRNFQRDNEFLLQQNNTTISQPSLFIHGDRDMVNLMYPHGPIEAMQPWVSEQHKGITIKRCGHWTQQEKPDQVNDLLLRWLSDL